MAQRVYPSAAVVAPPYDRTARVEGTLDGGCVSWLGNFGNEKDVFSDDAERRTSHVDDNEARHGRAGEHAYVSNSKHRVPVRRHDDMVVGESAFKHHLVGCPSHVQLLDGDEIDMRSTDKSPGNSVVEGRLAAENRRAYKNRHAS